MQTLLAPSTESGAQLVVIGAGGNIGSHLVPLLARMPGVGRLTLIDRDVYEARNLVSQDAGARDVGQAKVLVQARRVRRINPALCVAALHDAVEHLPLGVLRGDAILTCLDSRRARQHVNEASRRLGVPWIDAGVRADGLLARVTIHSNVADSPCMECAWDDRDYAALEQWYPCSGGAKAPPTLAPASLGALAAALQALECQRLVGRTPGEPVECREIVVNARHHAMWTTVLRRNEACRLSDHSPWKIERLPDSAADWSFARLVAERAADLPGQDASFSVAGRHVLFRRRCAGCDAVRARIRVGDASSARALKCPRCGGAMRATGFDCGDTVSATELSCATLDSSLRRLGVRPNDVLTMRTHDHTWHLEVGAASRATPTRPSGDFGNSGGSTLQHLQSTSPQQ